MKRSSELTLIDLMRLAESGADAQSILKTGFEWQHARRLELSKWLLTLGAGSLIAIFTLLARDNLPPSFVIWTAAALAGAGIGVGLDMFRRTQRVHVRYADATLLCTRLAEIRPFLTLLKQDDLL